MHYSSSGQSSRSSHQQQQQHSSTTTTTTTTRRLSNGRYNGAASREPARQYGSMINISFKNTVTAPKTTHFVQASIATQPPPQKPERTYKSTLSRSKSFNVEIADDGVVTTPLSNGYAAAPTHLRSTAQLNRLNETPPLKSPGILASISRSNRDLMMRNGKHDY